MVCFFLSTNLRFNLHFEYILSILLITILDEKINKKCLTYESVVNVPSSVFQLRRPRRLFGFGHIANSLTTHLISRKSSRE